MAMSCSHPCAIPPRLATTPPPHSSLFNTFRQSLDAPAKCPFPGPLDAPIRRLTSGVLSCRERSCTKLALFLLFCVWHLLGPPRGSAGLYPRRTGLV